MCFLPLEANCTIWRGIVPLCECKVIIIFQVKLILAVSMDSGFHAKAASFAEAFMSSNNLHDYTSLVVS